MIFTFLVEISKSYKEVLMKKLLVALLVTLPSVSAIAAVGTAQALQVVETALSIEKQSDLDFGTGVQGDPAKTVDADTSETAGNASFKVSGQPNKAYSITLPDNDSVVMTTGAGSSSTQVIAVNNFASYPAQGANGQLSAAGEEMLYIGATRDALLPNQEAGSYSATFTVTVVY
jgi:hypothetical protein